MKITKLYTLKKKTMYIFTYNQNIYIKTKLFTLVKKISITFSRYELDKYKNVLKREKLFVGIQGVLKKYVS